MDRLRIWKRTGTHADSFAAIGLASWLDSARMRCQIVDIGEAWEIRTESAIVEENVRPYAKSLGFRYLLAKNKDPLPETIARDQVLRYEDEREKTKRYREAQKQAREGGFEIHEQEPVKDWRLYQALNVLQGDGPSNAALKWAAEQDEAQLAKTLVGGWRELSGGKCVKSSFAPSLVQLFNPQAAKGYARLKPDSTGRNDKTKDAWGEPLEELLRIRGYFSAGCPFLLDDDVRVLCPQPHAIGYRHLEHAILELRTAPIYGSAAKVDVLATLYLAEILIRKSEEYARPNRWISGLTVAHYQSMGSAKAVTRLERLSAPNWFPLTSREEAEFWLEALQEHRTRLRLLKDDNSEELGMLIMYRRHLQESGRASTERLIDFFEQYGIFLLRKRGQNEWRHKQFLSKHLEAIVEQTDYRGILTNSGFQAIASALRSATVAAQSRKRNKLDYREIRYDILPELRRKRTLPNPGELLEAITDFIASYNAESARRLEQNKPSGIRRIRTEELEEFLELFDKEKPAVLGALLCAYATCRAVRDSDDTDAAGTTEQEVSNVDN